MLEVKNLSGEQGGVILGSTTGTYTAASGGAYLRCVTALTTCTISAVTMDDMADAADLVGMTLGAGQTIWGSISAITISGGLAQGLYSRTQND